MAQPRLSAPLAPTLGGKQWPNPPSQWPNLGKPPFAGRPGRLPKALADAREASIRALADTLHPLDIAADLGLSSSVIYRALRRFRRASGQPTDRKITRAKQKAIL
jgi:hypothetical protein